MLRTEDADRPKIKRACRLLVPQLLSNQEQHVLSKWAVADEPFESKRRMCWVLFPQAIGAPNTNLPLGRGTCEHQPKLLGRF